MGGREGGGGAGGKPKEIIWTQAAVLCLQYGTRTGTIHRVGQGCCQGQPGIPCSPMNVPQSREMHPRGFPASVKSRL